LSTDRRFLLTALLFALAGMALGAHMATSGRHEQHVTHAHLLLVGFVLSFIHAVIHRLWLQSVSPIWARVHYGAHTAGALGMSAVFWLMFSGFTTEAQGGPYLAAAGTLVMLGVVMPLVKVWRSPAAPRQA
jgi:hypothetical protein